MGLEKPNGPQGSSLMGPQNGVWDRDAPFSRTFQVAHGYHVRNQISGPGATWVTAPPREQRTTGLKQREPADPLL